MNRLSWVALHGMAHSLIELEEAEVHVIRLVIFFATKDREALYSQQKQDQGLTEAQIINSLLQNSD